MAFHERMRQLRQEQGLSQQELGSFLQVSKASVSKLETGKLQPSLQHIIALAQFFSVSADYLLAIVDKRLPAQEPIKEPSPVESSPPDPFRAAIGSILAGEYTDIEKDILRRCLAFGQKQIQAIRNERMGYRHN